MSTDQIPGYDAHQPHTVEHREMCAECADDWPCGTAMAYAAGLAAGRKHAADAIRAMNAAYEHAVGIVEGGEPRG